MFAEFLNIVFSSLKLDKNLYRNNKNFGEAAIYFAGLIMILDGVAGAVAANTIIKTSIGISGLTAILTWLVWALFIYVIGVKIFPDKETNVSFKKVLIAVGYAHSPGLLRFFALTPDLVYPHAKTPRCATHRKSRFYILKVSCPCTLAQKILNQLNTYAPSNSGNSVQNKKHNPH